MHQFHVHSGARAATFDNTTSLLAHLDTLLGTREGLTVFLPKLAIDAARGIASLLERYCIEVVLTADSAPETTDYLAQTLLGGAAGGMGGVVGGVWVLSALSRAGYLIPGVGWFVTAATLLGILGGAVSGFAVTRMGLRVRLVQAEMVQINLAPLRA